MSDVIQGIDFVKLTDYELSVINAACLSEIQRRSEFAGHDFSQIVANEVAKRTLLVAMVGNHSVLVVGEPGSGKSMVRSAALSMCPDLVSFETLPCACGYVHSLKKPCSCKAEDIERFRSFWPGTQILCEVTPPSVRELQSNLPGTSSETLSLQITAAREFLEKRGTSMRLDPMAKALLDRAQEDLGFSHEVRKNVIRVSRSIAALAASEVLQAAHVAEAINIARK